jgi:hypothetical protein
MQFGESQLRRKSAERGLERDRRSEDEREACRWWKIERSQAHWCFERSFPLTPALSLGARENRPPLRGELNALGRADVSALNRGAHGDNESDA